MGDPTENVRRFEQMVINSMPMEALKEYIYDRTWTTEELQEEFIVLRFLAPYVIVKRKDTGEEGTMQFRHHPRIYFNYQKDNR